MSIKRRKKKSRTLSLAQLRRKVFKGVEINDKLNFFEQYAMFMGKEQLVEFGLKRILINKYGYSESDVEKPLGKLISLLEKNAVRKDFVALLKELNTYRIEIAHNLLADDAIIRRLVGPGFENLSLKPLRYGLYIVEQVIHVHDFLFTK